MVNKIVLDKDYSNYSVDLEYKFGIVKSREDGRDRNFTTIQNTDPSAARHFGFQPGETNPTINWLLYDDGTDKSNGSLSSSNISDARFTSTDSNGNSIIKTVDEQIIWLVEYIHDNSSDPRWLLFGGRFSDRDGDGTDEGTNVVIKRPRITEASDRPTSAQGQIDLKLGVTI